MSICTVLEENMFVKTFTMSMRFRLFKMSPEDHVRFILSHILKGQFTTEWHPH